ASANHERDRKRELTHDDRVSQSAPGRAITPCAPAFTKRAVEPAIVLSKCRDNTERHTGNHRHDRGENQRRDVDTDRDVIRHIVREAEPEQSNSIPGDYGAQYDTA